MEATSCSRTCTWLERSIIWGLRRFRIHRRHTGTRQPRRPRPWRASPAYHSAASTVPPPGRPRCTVRGPVFLDGEPGPRPSIHVVRDEPLFRCPASPSHGRIAPPLGTLRWGGSAPKIRMSNWSHRGHDSGRAYVTQKLRTRCPAPNADSAQQTPRSDQALVYECCLHVRV